MPCTAGSRSLRNDVLHVLHVTPNGGVTLLYTYAYTYMYMKNYLPHFPWNIRIARPRLHTFPGDTAAVKLALDFTCGNNHIIMGTGTAAHHTADDTGRDEVMSEHVPLPTGGIGRMPLMPLQTCKKKWAAAYRIRQSVVFLHAPRAGSCP
jgi:hypothetical protein